MSEPRSVSEICKDISNSDHSFYIPDYQRGYRWDKEQAEDLLNDVKSFFDEHFKEYISGADVKERYFIQPLVVREDKKNKVYRVIDGQQRLTTFSLILLALNQLKDMNILDTSIVIPQRYDIEYENRPNSRDFLNKDIISNPNRRYDYLDFLHMFNVYDSVKAWLSDFISHNKEISVFIKCLFEHVVFIWHEIDGKVRDEIETFERLNVYKISLTESELIKALFLNESNSGKDNKLIWNIASEWDAIESKLQDDAFWAFIHTSEYKKPTRIDFIFDLIYKHDKFGLKERLADRFASIEKSEHQSFKYFVAVFDCIKNKTDGFNIKQTWKTVKDIFRVFEEWYSDYKLFHYIGYLVTVSETNNKVITGEELIFKLLKEWSKTGCKAAFISVLESYIADVIRTKNWATINTLNWKTQEFEDGISKRECNDLLLLHNIETIVRQNDALVSSQKYNLPNFTKFPFHLYRIEKWETEHIRPNSGDSIVDVNTKRFCLAKTKEYLKDNSIRKRVDNYIQAKGKTEPEPFNSLYEAVLIDIGAVDNNSKNLISNYTLLDKTTNTEYGNLIFPIKQAYIRNKENGFKIKYHVDANGEIIEDDRSEEVAFILPCTKNVFTSFYSTNKDNKTFWSEEDARDYLDDMDDKIGRFICFACERRNAGKDSLIVKSKES